LPGRFRAFGAGGGRPAATAPRRRAGSASSWFSVGNETTILCPRRPGRLGFPAAFGLSDRTWGADGGGGGGGVGGGGGWGGGVGGGGGAFGLPRRLAVGPAKLCPASRSARLRARNSPADGSAAAVGRVSDDRCTPGFPAGSLACLQPAAVRFPSSSTRILAEGTTTLTSRSRVRAETRAARTTTASDRGCCGEGDAVSLDSRPRSRPGTARNCTRTA